MRPGVIAQTIGGIIEDGVAASKARAWRKELDAAYGNLNESFGLDRDGLAYAGTGSGFSVPLPDGSEIIPAGFASDAAAKIGMTAT